MASPRASARLLVEPGIGEERRIVEPADALDEQQRCRGAGRDGCIRRAERMTARRHGPPCRYRGTSTPVAEVGECLQTADPAAVRKRSQAHRHGAGGAHSASWRLGRRPAPSLTSKRALARIGTTAFILGPTRAPLLLCHACGSRVDSVVVTAGDRRVVRDAQSAAADTRPRARGTAFPNGRRARALDGLPARRVAAARRRHLRQSRGKFGMPSLGPTNARPSRASTGTSRALESPASRPSRVVRDV